ncbi:MAG: hypothetical protein RBS57_03255 [Desulforhabdus sp.]|nr:hypothetical protein [Desulforhabdus sp.]
MTNNLNIDDLIRRYRISMKTAKVGFNPIASDEYSTDDKLHHYKCSLFRNGAHVDVYLSVQPEEGRLTLADVLFMLSMDASGCHMLRELDEYRNEWPAIFGGSDGNMKEIENFWSEYQNRCKQTAQFKDFLGDSAYDELLHHFNRQNPMNELVDTLSESML